MCVPILFRIMYIEQSDSSNQRHQEEDCSGPRPVRSAHAIFESKWNPYTIHTSVIHSYVALSSNLLSIWCSWTHLTAISSKANPSNPLNAGTGSSSSSITHWKSTLIFSAPYLCMRDTLRDTSGIARAKAAFMSNAPCPCLLWSAGQHHVRNIMLCCSWRH